MPITDLPEVLTPQDIATHLRVSRSTVYELLKKNPKHGGIPNVALGLSKRVDREDFLKWKETMKAERERKVV